jgi:hypothetical protein
MNTVEAYCPACDKVHQLHANPGGKNYYCIEMGGFALVDGGYAGYRICSPRTCRCAHYAFFGEHIAECPQCMLPIMTHHYGKFMPRFTSKMLYEAREGAGGRKQHWDRFAVTFPRRFKRIITESNAANAAALAPHLPSVIINIVRDYLTYPYV